MCRKPYHLRRIRESTDAENAAKAHIDALIARQLPSVRATAENWRNGVGFGAVASTLVGVFKAPELVKSATAQEIANGTWLLGISIVLAVASFALALRASFGWPAFETISTENDLRQWESNEIAITVGCLWVSMALVIPAFLGFCTAAGVLIFHVPLPLQFPSWQQ
ncbi:hypothetical protein D2E53_11345 [Mycobacteroides abscessus]|nr:hypothetical protein DDT48_24720 [Mycobacteroides abscessus]RIR54266.1 hypothetical protein D2E37_14015 [Mycobacteroides abscessus]RIS82310.1 hypothetical protein D2E53_11345 [Mycobacteroides abscessus]RIU06133.1 hypothetical protein D2E94_18745 [Mycobacteroides abscessus]